MDSIEIAVYGGALWCALFVLEHLWCFATDLWSKYHDIH